MSKRAIECDIFEEPSTKLQELSTPETEIQAIVSRILYNLDNILIFSIIRNIILFIFTRICLHFPLSSFTVSFPT